MPTLLEAYPDLSLEAAYHCNDCEAVTTDEPESPLYECGNCSERFDRANSADGASHKCPQCNKFSAKVADYACPDCQGEVEQVEAYICPMCAEPITADEAEDAEECPRCSDAFAIPEDDAVEDPGEDEDEPEKLIGPIREPIVEEDEPSIVGPSKQQTYLTFDLVLAINQRSTQAGRSRVLNEDAFILNANRLLKYPTLFEQPHHDGSEMRVGFVISAEQLDQGKPPLWLDMSWEDWKALPKRTIPDTEAGGAWQ